MTDKPKDSLVGVLDALGASLYESKQVFRFLRAREQAMLALSEKVENHLPDPSRFETFTFNDTIVIVMRGRDDRVSLDDVSRYLTILRKFFVASLAHGILFRGAVSIAPCHVHSDTNTVLGEAISDAASWYERAEWVGVHLTPKACIRLDSMLEGIEDGHRKHHLLLDYDVPCKASSHVAASCPLKALNWPKGLQVPDVKPDMKERQPRGWVLHTLGREQIPLGTQDKYFNTIRFFDYAVKENSRLEKIKKTTPKTQRKN